MRRLYRRRMIGSGSSSSPRKEDGPCWYQTSGPPSGGDAVEAIERCYELGCTGGLPVVPPTVERVEEALSFSGRHAGEVLGWIPERRREITVEKVAANAVNMESRRGVKCSTSDGSTGDPMHYKTSESTSTSYHQVIHDGD